MGFWRPSSARSDYLYRECPATNSKPLSGATSSGRRSKRLSLMDEYVAPHGAWGDSDWFRVL